MLYTGGLQNLAYPANPSNLAYPANLLDPLLLEWVKYLGNLVMVPAPDIGLKDFTGPQHLLAWPGLLDQKLNTARSSICTSGILDNDRTTDGVEDAFELLYEIISFVTIPLGGLITVLAESLRWLRSVYGSK